MILCVELIPNYIFWLTIMKYNRPIPSRISARRDIIYNSSRKNHVCCIFVLFQCNYLLLKWIYYLIFYEYFKRLSATVQYLAKASKKKKKIVGWGPLKYIIFYSVSLAAWCYNGISDAVYITCYNFNYHCSYCQMTDRLMDAQ